MGSSFELESQEGDVDEVVEAEAVRISSQEVDDAAEEVNRGRLSAGGPSGFSGVLGSRG